MADLNAQLDFIINQLQAGNRDLAEDNNYADWKAEQREQFNQALLRVDHDRALALKWHQERVADGLGGEKVHYVRGEK